MKGKILWNLMLAFLIHVFSKQQFGRRKLWLEVLKGTVMLERKSHQWVSKSLKGDHRQRVGNRAWLSWSSSNIKCVKCLKFIKNFFQTPARPKSIKVTLSNDQKVYSSKWFLFNFIPTKIIGTLRIMSIKAC